MHDRGCVESTLLLITQCTSAEKSKEVNKNIQNEVCLKRHNVLYVF